MALILKDDLVGGMEELERVVTADRVRSMARRRGVSAGTLARMAQEAAEEFGVRDLEDLTAAQLDRVAGELEREREAAKLGGTITWWPEEAA